MNEWISPTARSDDAPMMAGASASTAPQIVMWSKDNCVFCDRAKQLLTEKGLTYEERNLSHGTWTKDQLIDVAPHVRSLPQIFWGGKHVGGHKELMEFFAGVRKLEG